MTIQDKKKMEKLKKLATALDRDLASKGKNIIGVSIERRDKNTNNFSICVYIDQETDRKIIPAKFKGQPIYIEIGPPAVFALS